MSDWQSFPKSYRAAGLILLIGLLVTGYVSHSVKSDIDLDAQRQFASDCDETQLKIEGRLQTHKQVLLGGAALFDASHSVSRSAWHDYAQRVEIDQQFNGIQGFGFALWIPKNNLAHHISEIRRQGFPKYIVNPVGERDEYSSIIYLEPFKERNLRAFGYDMYSEPVRRAAMEQARDENIISLSDKVTLVQETGKEVQAGTLMYVPVYRKSMPIVTVAQRRAALYGWVYSPFRMDDLLHGVLHGSDNPRNRFLRLQVYDGHTPKADGLLYQSEASREATSSVPVLFTLERHMNFNGHEWTLHFEQLRGSVSGTDYSKAWMILTGGMGLSILSFFLMLSYLNTRRNAAQIADKLTAESRKVSRYVRSLIEASLDPLVTISPEGIVTDVNQATEKVTGRSRSELLGTDFSDYFTEPDKAREGYRRVFDKSFVTDYPLVIRHRDGHVTDVLYNASIYRNEAGEVMGVFAAARDVTERKKAEFVLRQSEEGLKEAQRMAHLGSWYLDLATNQVFWSEELYRMYGFDPALPPPLFTESMKLFTPESWESLSTAIAQTSETGIPYELELETVLKDGSRGWMLARGELVRDASGAPVRVRGVAMDITERKLAEKLIREKEERLVLATTNNGVGIWDWNLETQEMIWDDSMYALYHMRREDFIGTEEAWRASLHPEDRTRGDQEVADAISGKKPFETEFRVVWPNGEIHHIKAIAKVFRDDGGTPLRMLGINMDITERKRAEEALLERERHSQSLLRLSRNMERSQTYAEVLNAAQDEVKIVLRYQSLWVYLFTEDKQYLKAIVASGPVSDTVMSEEGTATLTIKGDRMLEEIAASKEIVLVEDARTDERVNKTIAESLKMRTIVNIPIMLFDHHMGCVGTGTFGDEGVRVPSGSEQKYLTAMASHMAVALDRIHLLAERRKVEVTLRELNKDFITLLESTGDYIYFKDQDSRIRFCSQTLAEITGHASWREMIGKHDLEVFPEDTARIYHEEELPIFREGKSLLNKTDPYYNAQGKPGWVSSNKWPVFGDDGKTVVGIFGISRDITELKQAEDKINELNRDLELRVEQRTAQLEEANRELEAFSYSVSHDLRSPLRAIDGFSHILLDDYAAKLDNEGKRLLNVVRDNTMRMAQLIDDILKFSRTSRLEMTYSEIDMEGLAHEVVAELQPAGDRLQVQIDRIPPAKGDRAMMRQVFVNLLSNAIKFSSIREKAIVKVGGFIEESEAVYFVRDNGAGFDMQYADKLFGVFQRLHGVSEFEGTGIGLAIVKRIVTRHGGRVWAEGKVNEGAIMYFSIPTRAVIQNNAS